ncbi:MAG TPA: SprT-like domain-containing protein [Candidatus Acidoferrum sp.]|nr:SprT-like domain-containing protein [Candidatus Acidoferrum sp.]
MRPFEKLVSIAALSVIIGGAVYAYRREKLANTDLNSMFQEINQKYFSGGLPGVHVEWGYLDQEYGETRRFDDGKILILVDTNENTSASEVRRTLRHEACHIFVGSREPEEHGPMFQACMARFR